MAARKPLAGRVIAVPETRELERLSKMLEQKGATTLRYPLVSVLDAPDTAAVEAWLMELVRGELDDLIFMTAEGFVRLMGFANRSGLLDRVIHAIARVRTVTRGPKASRALRDIGLLPSLTPETPTTDGVIDLLREVDLEGRTVGLQLYGQEPNHRLVKFLMKAGARVREVVAYVYSRGIDDDGAIDLIRRMAEGSVDSIAFTCGAQVDRLFAVATERGVDDQLRAGLERTRIAAVGPIAAASLRRRGFRVAAVPRNSFFMRSLVDEVVAALRTA
jgi:uroporphyrinogen-III synthase